jgi:hypothetical protein
LSRDRAHHVSDFVSEPRPACDSCLTGILRRSCLGVNHLVDEPAASVRGAHDEPCPDAACRNSELSRAVRSRRSRACPAGRGTAPESAQRRPAPVCQGPGGQGECRRELQLPRGRRLRRRQRVAVRICRRCRRAPVRGRERLPRGKRERGPSGRRPGCAGPGSRGVDRDAGPRPPALRLLRQLGRQRALDGGDGIPPLRSARERACRRRVPRPLPRRPPDRGNRRKR